MKSIIPLLSLVLSLVLLPACCFRNNDCEKPPRPVCVKIKKTCEKPCRPRCHKKPRCEKPCKPRCKKKRRCEENGEMMREEVSMEREIAE